MENKTGNWVAWVALALVVGSIAVQMYGSTQVRSAFGAAGNMLAENYIPYVQYNDGYTSAKGITLTGSAGDLTVGDDATISGGSLVVTTAANATSSATIGSLVIYATSSATTVTVCASTKGATSTFNGTLYFTYGTCAN